MRAQAGDKLTVRGRHQGDEDRHGTIIRVDGAPPYLGCWRDGTRACSSPHPAPGSSITPPAAPGGGMR